MAVPKEFQYVPAVVKVWGDCVAGLVKRFSQGSILAASHALALFARLGFEFLIVTQLA